MKVMVFDVGGTEIKYSVMDEQMNRFDAGSVPTPQDTQEHFLDTIYALYAPHKDEVDGIAMALPGFVDANTGYVSNGGALLYNTGTQVVKAPFSGDNKKGNGTVKTGNDLRGSKNK